MKDSKLEYSTRDSVDKNRNKNSFYSWPWRKWTFWYRRRYNALVRLIQYKWTTKKCVAFTYKQMITASDREAFTGCKYHAFIWRQSTPTSISHLIWNGDIIHYFNNTRIDGMEKSFYHSHQEDGYSHCNYYQTHKGNVLEKMLWLNRSFQIKWKDQLW
jgi:hypothetical protein